MDRKIYRWIEKQTVGQKNRQNNRKIDNKFGYVNKQK